MAFNFLGIFSNSQWEELRSFVRSRSKADSLRLSTLRNDIYRQGWIVYTQRDPSTNVPTQYRVEPPESTLARLVSSYEAAGGSILSLNIRSRGNWLFISRGEFSFSFDDNFQGGFPSGTTNLDGYFINRHLDDGGLAPTLDKYKRWVLPIIRQELEVLEYKIKKCVDLTDQYLIEAIEIYKRVQGTEPLAELESLVENALSNPTAYPFLRRNE
jgi:hypothetical protein